LPVSIWASKPLNRSIIANPTHIARYSILYLLVESGWVMVEVLAV